MPYDSQGNFYRIHNWEQDRQDDIEIVSDRHDEEDNNFAEGLSQCVLRDGRAALIGNLNLGNNKIQNVANASASKDAVNKGQMDTTINSAKSTLTTNYQNYVKTVLSQIYPVGSLYITTNNAATCPLASLISGSSWSLVAADKALWTSNRNANTTINAGLPNIKGEMTAQCMMNYFGKYESGALYQGNSASGIQTAGGTDGDCPYTVALDASKSNSIYGASTTVQPPAYRVNVWRRTA
ncbi:MAG: hypothetical protein IJS88_02005 [Alphaproteobacteria bacterium]|nr:hypothetical protein [Alphaproteobacteria bacterium]